MIGGFEKPRTATDEIKDIAYQVRREVQSRLNVNFDKFEAVSYRSQVVAGVNYLIKVDVGNGSFIHIKVFQPLPYTNEGPSLSDVTIGKTLRDPL